MKLLAFPIRDRRWAFLPVPFGRGDPSGEVRDLSVRAIFRELRALNSFAARADLLSERLVQKGNLELMKLHMAREGSFKRRIHWCVEKLLSRVPPTEIFLKSFPSNTARINIVYPSGKSPGYRRSFYLSLGVLPFSILFGLVPVPNFVLAWNLYRSVSYWRALRGCEQVLRMAPVDEAMEAVAAPAAAMALPPADEGSVRSNATEGDQMGQPLLPSAAEAQSIGILSEEETHPIPVLLIPSDELKALLAAMDEEKTPPVTSPDAANPIPGMTPSPSPSLAGAPPGNPATKLPDFDGVYKARLLIVCERFDIEDTDTALKWLLMPKDRL
eukprot:jgi/Mesvir1/9768/Mv12221-RA.2